MKGTYNSAKFQKSQASLNNSGGMSNSQMPNINKTNVTLWKSKYVQNQGSTGFEEEKKVEGDYIENLNKQIYFMEMELKLMKEREKEIEKTGGFTQLFNDERDPSQHITQLKNKYSTMRKSMEAKIMQLNEKKRAVTGDNVSFKAKYEVVSKLEKEVYDKLVSQTDLNNNKVNTLSSEYAIKNRERNELEAINRAFEHDIQHETENNKQLDYNLNNTQKMEEMKQKEYESSLKLRDDLNKFKQDEYLEIDKRIKDLNAISSDDPIVKVEYEKNVEYKKKIDNIEKELIMASFKVEELEVSNDFLIKRKEETIEERKKFIGLNEELKREIEQKSQLNEMRIQKKVKENNSEEIQKMQEDLKEYIAKGEDFEKKIQVEYDKSKAFTSDIIKHGIEIRHREQKKEKLLEVIDEKFKVIDELKEKVEELKDAHLHVSDKLSKGKVDYEMLKNRNKLLSEEHSSITSKLEFITKNYDTSSSLKKISMEDMRVLTQTNSLVNDSINAFVNKVGTFKSNQIPTSIFDDNQV
mmetsp:Transcript_29477/g.30593  ORF Transcript_29477/g.30593 Transcript_29477/m.30593 type:complete len:524 (+) Transcript_29477:2-1573(+)